MSLQQRGLSLMQNLEKAFRDANLETAQHEILPTLQNETSQFHLFRIMEFWNRQMAEDTPTNLICSQVVLTLLQCASRLYKDKLHAQAAMDLIESRDTKAVINLAIQDFLFWFVHQQYMKRIKSEEENVENYFRGAELSSVIRKNKARRLNCQAKIFEHISFLCHSHTAALQNGFEIPRTDEEEILHNYVELTRGYSRCEKSWLIALLPELVQNDVEDHQGQDPRGERPLKEIYLDTSSSTASTPILQEGNLRSLEYVENLYWSLNQGSEEPYTPIIKGVLRTSPNHVVSKERNNFANDSDIDYLDLNLESLPRKGSKSNKGIYSRRRAATSSLKMRASEQKSKPIDIRIEKIKHQHDDPELEIPRDSGWEPLRSDDSNQSIFSFSPDARERKSLLHEEEGDQSPNMPSTRDDQLTRSLAVDEVSRRSSQLLEPSEWMRTYKGERNLYTIYEELHGEII